MTQITRVLAGSRWLAVVIAALTVASCGGGDSSSPATSSQAAPVTSSAPPPVTPAPAPAPTVGTATLSWTAPDQNTDGSPLTNLAGYRIYYGTSQNDLSQVINVTNVGITDYVIDNLASGTYYFSIRSYNTMGMESTLSNIVSDTIS